MCDTGGSVDFLQLCTYRGTPRVQVTLEALYVLVCLCDTGGSVDFLQLCTYRGTPRVRDNICNTGDSVHFLQGGFPYRSTIVKSRRASSVTHFLTGSPIIGNCQTYVCIRNGRDEEERLEGAVGLGVEILSLPKQP